MNALALHRDGQKARDRLWKPHKRLLTRRLKYTTQPQSRGYKLVAFQAYEGDFSFEVAFFCFKGFFSYQDDIQMSSKANDN